MIVHIAIVYRGFGKYEAVPFLNEMDFQLYLEETKDVVGHNPITVPDFEEDNRQVCPDCGGEGVHYYELPLPQCETCHGTGEVTLEVEQAWLAGNGGGHA